MSDTNTLISSPEEIAEGLLKKWMQPPNSGQVFVLADIASAIAAAETRGAMKSVVSAKENTAPDFEAMANAEIVGEVRRFSHEVTGGNCMFADDDLKVLATLAKWAIENGVPDEIAPNILPRAKARRNASGQAEASTPSAGAEN